MVHGTMAALNGDDEIELLLSQMGGEAPVEATTTTTSAGVVTSEKKKKKDKGERLHKREKKRKRDGDVSHDEVNDSSNIFAESRLTQNPFEWPCSSTYAKLSLRCGLAHDCSGYTSSEKEERKFGSNLCKNCGKSGATHELYIKSSRKNIDITFSVFMIALMITSSRNARCLLAEYYPNESVKQNNHLLPPINSTPAAPNLIVSKLDFRVGIILSELKEMERDGTSSALESNIGIIRE